MTRRRLPPASVSPAGTATRYRDRIFDDNKHDPYQANGKYREPTVCGHCHAVYHGGRWTWAATPEGAREERCPACLRTQDSLPAGSVTLTGGFLGSHRDEVLALIRHVAAREREVHPLHRLMRVEELADRIVVTTTDIHSPQRIAEALKSAYQGHFKIHYGHDEYAVRVDWRR